MRHGKGPDAPTEALLWDDPALALVYADLRIWSDAHPCDCDALCVCEQEDE